MSTPLLKPFIDYPDSDGQPMAENTLQFKWIVTVKENLGVQYRRDPNVFVAGDLLWYPVEGQPKVRQAPDALVAFGRPKGYRGSYKQWVEGGIAPQVVFEILSPNNRVNEMTRKFQFYERHGVEEYYIYDPDKVELFGWVREGGVLREIPDMEGWVSPLLGARFSLASGDLVITGPDGRRFLTFEELTEERDREAERAEEEARRAEDAERRLDQETQSRKQAEEEIERLRAKLREREEEK